MDVDADGIESDYFKLIANETLGQSPCSYYCFAHNPSFTFMSLTLKSSLLFDS